MFDKNAFYQLCSDITRCSVTITLFAFLRVQSVSLCGEVV